LKKKVRKIEVLNLITKAIKTPTVSPQLKKPYNENEKGVPQGLSISNILASIYMRDLDVVFSQRENFTYFRYVDDILILCNKNDKVLLEHELNINVEELGLSINNDKNVYGYLTQEFTFLGYEFKDKSAGVRQGNVYKLEKTLIEIFTRYKYSDYSRTSEFVWSLNLVITGGIIDEKKYGWLFFYSQIDDKEMLYRLDWFIEKLFKRFNITHISKKTIKSFVKTYHEIIYNRSNSRVIPNFDKYSIQQKKDFLRSVMNYRNTNKLDDETIDRHFRRYVFKAIKKLEKDIQHIS
jgi:RNA-directed DNA polymerase